MAQNRELDGDGSAVNLPGRNQDDYSDGDTSSVCSNPFANELPDHLERGFRGFKKKLRQDYAPPPSEEDILNVWPRGVSNPSVASLRASVTDKSRSTTSEKIFGGGRSDLNPACDENDALPEKEALRSRKRSRNESPASGVDPSDVNTGLKSTKVAKNTSLAGNNRNAGSVMTKNQVNLPAGQSNTTASGNSAASSILPQIIDGLRERAEEREKSSGMKSRGGTTSTLQKTPNKTKSAFWVYADCNRVTKFFHAHLNYGGKRHLREVFLKRNLKKTKRFLTNDDGVYFEALKRLHPGEPIRSRSAKRAKICFLGGKYESLLRRDTCWKKSKYCNCQCENKKYSELESF